LRVDILDISLAIGSSKDQRHLPVAEVEGDGEQLRAGVEVDSAAIRSLDSHTRKNNQYFQDSVSQAEMQAKCG
jgi:hypothetical protein